MSHWNGRTIQAMAHEALTEIAMVLCELTDDVGKRMCAEILHASRIVCFGVGREGLMMKALCMRLIHLGLDAHVVGDMTTPPIGKGDLLLVSAGPGSFSTVLALLYVAREAGARTMVITANPSGTVPQNADVIIHLPAQTMADDRGASVSLLPMGSLYEVVQLIFSDLVCILVREEMGQSADEMRARHTNLE